MEILRKPIWRVPLVLCALGILNRLLHFSGGLIWGSIQRARGPGPDGVTVLTTGYVAEIVTAVMFVLFWWAGWRFVRGLTRRQIFVSASIMVLINIALLAVEQITQAIGVGFLTAYRLYALAEGTAWVDRLLFYLTGTVSLPLAVLGSFAPFLYLVFGRGERRG